MSVSHTVRFGVEIPTVTAYYNEKDEFAAQWLRNLIAAGHIAPGDVDERDMWDVKPDDLRGYTQAHFCAGIGIWSLALRRAGWEDSRPVWTGSFPCQPFSAAGKRLGTADPRHLFPLVDAYPNRVGVLRAAGNALDAAQAEGFVRAWMECVP